MLVTGFAMLIIVKVLNMKGILITFFAMFLVVVGCKNNNDEEDVAVPMETIKKGYFKTPTNQKDIDDIFVKQGVRGMRYFTDRWCAFVGDSITLLVGTKDMMSSHTNSQGVVTPFFSAWIYAFVNGNRYTDCQINCEKDDVFRLVEDMPITVCKNCLIIPLRNQKQVDYFSVIGQGYSGSFMACFDYILDYEKGLIVYHNADGNYFKSNLAGTYEEPYRE